MVEFLGRKYWTNVILEAVGWNHVWGGTVSLRCWTRETLGNQRDGVRTHLKAEKPTPIIENSFFMK